jgi:hypothetical protein
MKRWIAVLLAGVVSTLAVERALVFTRNPNLAPSLILLGAATVPAAFLTFLYGRRLPCTIGAGTVAVAALLGGVIGSTAAGVLEYDTQHTLGTLPTVGVALIEEACKLLVPLGALLVLRRARWTPSTSSPCAGCSAPPDTWPGPASARPRSSPPPGPDGRSAAPSGPCRRSPWWSACTPPGTPPA